MGTETTATGLEIANRFVWAAEDEWPLLFEQLRQNGPLSSAVHQINLLLDRPDHRQLAIAAFRRIGLWHDGQLDDGWRN